LFNKVTYVHRLYKDADKHFFDEQWKIYLVILEIFDPEK